MWATTEIMAGPTHLRGRGSATGPIVDDRRALNWRCWAGRGGCLQWGCGCSTVPGMELSDRDRSILDFERSWWTESGPKEAAIRERFELSAARYYQILGELLESDEAYEYDPLVVRRLRRLRDRRRRARHEGFQATENPGR